MDKIIQKYSQDELVQRAFFRCAWNIKQLWEEKGSSDTRILLEPFISNQIVTVGQSKNKGNYREHAVPRMLICIECHTMLEQGKSVEDLANFIRKFLKIVLISKEEQQTLDKSSNLNLKQKMPEGWTFASGSPFDRLKAAGIEYDLFPEHDRFL